MKANILLVDNDPDFLDTLAALLELSNFRVYKARSRKEAEELARVILPHVLIVDIRLRNDNDSKDTSGLALVKSDDYHLIPKIVMTRWPTYEAVREALGPVAEGLPAAVDFVAKQEGPDALIAALKTAFERYVRVNWNLAIESSGGAFSFHHLVTAIHPESDDELIVNRSSELEDLFRRLFFQQKRIRIDRLLWRRGSRVGLAVYGFSDDRAPESFVIVCGDSAEMAKESGRYREFAPPATLSPSTVLIRAAETLRYCGNLYALAGANFEEVVSLSDLHKNEPDRLFNSALQNLFERTLAEWHRDRRVVSESSTVGQYYAGLLRDTALGVDNKMLRERIRSILRLTPTIGEHIELSDGMLTARFKGQTFSYPDPSSFCNRLDLFGGPLVSINTPGTLTGENVLADSSGRTWVTDFADAGMAPLLWNFVSLEAAIRFDWVEANKLQWLHDMERALVDGDFTRIDPADIDQHLRRTLRSVLTLRKIGLPLVGKDAAVYRLGILFHALRRLADFEPSFPLLPGELTRLTHILLGAAMICAQLDLPREREPNTEGSEETGVRVDKTDKVIWVDGVRTTVRGNSFKILATLYDSEDHLCTRKELVEKVFEEKYDEMDASQVDKLNVAISRLRERIEDDADHPRYLITEPGIGYRLVTSVRTHSE